MLDIATNAETAALHDKESTGRARSNDFSIVVATINGSGSQTANAALLRAIFRMGIPVNGKNLFPSNISTQPTWYMARVNGEGYTARSAEHEILVAFNPSTAAADLAALPRGGVCFYSEDIPLDRSRDDVTYYPVPVKSLLAQIGVDRKQGERLANMTYVGVVAQLLGVELKEVHGALRHQFKDKARDVELSFRVIQAAAEHAERNLPKRDPYRVERMDATRDMLLMDGNTASALGVLMGGMTVMAWYPITPATSLADAVSRYAPQLRKEPQTERSTCVVIQAEDEIAAAGMLIGAGWMGTRAMTSTSGPGLSLMTEFVGFGYFAEVPIVIWDVMRMGPSTGMPTRVSQGDVLKAYFLGHGDVRNICLLPGNVRECFEFGQTGFDLAERFQQPVLVLSDLDLGMNQWMTPPLEYPTTPLDRGKVLNAEQLERMETWGRYCDLDKDGIPYRTLPGNEHPRAAYFTRGSGHNEVAGYTERSDDWFKNMDRLARKHEQARTAVPTPVIDQRDALVGLIAFGSADPPVQEARDHLRRSSGLETSYMRLRALPLGQDAADFIAAHERIYVIELNMDGQLHSLLCLHTPQHAARLRSVAYSDGLPLTARYIVGRVVGMERAKEEES